MRIDNILLDKLTDEAQASPRLRMNLDLRNSDADSSPRMLNAIEPGSVLPVHRHRSTSETVVVLRGVWLRSIILQMVLWLRLMILQLVVISVL